MKLNIYFKKNYRKYGEKDFVSNYDPFGSYTGNVDNDSDEKPEQDADDL